MRKRTAKEAEKMIIFVGNKEKGFFCEEIAERRNMEMQYIGAELHIENQAENIPKYKEEASVIIYDLEQYVDEPDEIVRWVIRIQDALGIKSVIFAPGYSPQSNVIQALYNSGISNYIFSVYLGEQKEDLELCLDGYYESFGYEEKRGISFTVQKVDEEDTEGEKTKVKCIGIAGAIARMGTTTQAIQLVKFFQYFGYKAAYFQMNTHHFVENLKEAYEQVEHEEEVGRVTYMKVDMYYRIDKLQEVLQKKNYDYIVFDYGVYSENGFNKISFLEKEMQIFVVGSKPGGEFESTYEVLKNNFYNNAYYIFNFVPKSEHRDILELMEEKENMTFFAEEAKDPFSFAGMETIYEKMIPIEPQFKKTTKKRKIFERRKSK